MYSALWHLLPGPVWVRIVILLVATAALLFCLVEWVFPWVNTLLPSQEATVGE